MPFVFLRVDVGIAPYTFFIYCEYFGQARTPKGRPYNN